MLPKLFFQVPIERVSAQVNHYPPGGRCLHLKIERSEFRFISWYSPPGTFQKTIEHVVQFQ